MYWEGKKIKARVPNLPEASGREGKSTGAATGSALHILAIGESTIAGVGVATHEEGFTGTFAHELSRLFELDVYWKVYARSGYTAKKVRTKIIPTITEQDVDLIVIGLGGNDAFTLNTPHRWNREIRQLIEHLRAKFPEALLVFCHMPPIKEFPAFSPVIKGTIGNLVEILGAELKQISQAYPNVFFPDEKISLQTWADRIPAGQSKADFFSDGVHPSRLTYQLWGREMAEQLFQRKELKEQLSRRMP
jgi:lysophospholipase L1-like esterase